MADLAKALLAAAAIALALGCGQDPLPAATPEIAKADSPAAPHDAAPLPSTPPTEVEPPPDAAALVAEPTPPEERCATRSLDVGTAPLGYRAVGEVCDEVRSGPWEFFYLVNDKKLRRGSYKDGVETGKWTFWYKSGRKRSEGRFKKGQRSGKWIRNHKNGQRSLEGRYKRGLRDGRWRRWHESGQLYEDRIYVAGQREGIHHKWNSDGLLQYTRLCKKDVCKVQCRARREKVCPPLTSASLGETAP